MNTRKRKRARTGTVRIIAGEWRRRHLHFPDDLTIRPTPERLRETLFNWLGDWIIGRRVLDLFAGSGALGIEALSRGAREAVFVEYDPRVARALSKNMRELGITQVHVEAAEARAWLAGAHQPFDLVLLDPPYALDIGPEMLGLPGVHALLGADHRVYLERSRERSDAPLPEGWEMLRVGRAGDAQGLLVRHE
jgi:16S rRNA (guanine966-N2)-methyltransferase